MKVLLTAILIPLVGIALPLYRAINPKGFPVYCIYCLLISLVLMYLVWGTELIFS